MTSRAPAISNGGAGLTGGHRQWRQMQEAYHGAEPQAKRSPKERSAVPGTVMMVSQVALDDPGIITPPIGQSDGSAPASKIAEVWGPTLEATGPGAGLPMPSAQALSNQQILSKTGAIT